jgi:hypothetical protein
LRVAVLTTSSVSSLRPTICANALVDLRLGLVVAPAEAAPDASERLLGLGEGALAGGSNLAPLFGGVDVGDPDLKWRPVVGV